MPVLLLPGPVVRKKLKDVWVMFMPVQHQEHLRQRLTLHGSDEKIYKLQARNKRAVESLVRRLNKKALTIADCSQILLSAPLDTQLAIMLRVVSADAWLEKLPPDVPLVWPADLGQFLQLVLIDWWEYRLNPSHYLGPSTKPPV